MVATNKEIKELQKELKDLAAMVKDNAKTSASNVIGFDSKDISRFAKKAGKNVRSYLAEKSKQATDLKETAEDKISSSPFKAVAAAAAVGAVIALFAKRK